jgi:hypothetical protein
MTLDWRYLRWDRQQLSLCRENNRNPVWCGSFLSSRGPLARLILTSMATGLCAKPGELTAGPMPGAEQRASQL